MLDSRRNIVLACALSGLASYVDGIGFLHLGGLFVSFMSGNSTRMGVNIAEGRFQSAAEAFGLIALFVVGAAAGSLIVLGQSRQAQGRVLLAETLLLVAGGLFHVFDLDDFAIAAIVLAMGLENAVFQIEGGGELAHLDQRARHIGEAEAALRLGSEFTVVGIDGGRRCLWRARLALDQSRRDLVRRGRRAGAERNRRGDDPPIA